VAVDRENRQFSDILFDRPLGEGKVDQILDPPPATIEPALEGKAKMVFRGEIRFNYPVNPETWLPRSASKTPGPRSLCR